MDSKNMTSKRNESTSNDTKNYVSGDRVPSSIDHRFTKFGKNNTKSKSSITDVNDKMK